MSFRPKSVFGSEFGPESQFIVYKRLKMEIPALDDSAGMTRVALDDSAGMTRVALDDSAGMTRLNFNISKLIGRSTIKKFIY